MEVKNGRQPDLPGMPAPEPKRGSRGRQARTLPTIRDQEKGRVDYDKLQRLADIVHGIARDGLTVEAVQARDEETAEQMQEDNEAQSPQPKLPGFKHSELDSTEKSSG